MKRLLFGMLIPFMVMFAYQPLTFSCSQDVDVLVVGASSSGISAAIQASRMGVKTMAVEGSPWLGGMLTAAGVSSPDGNYKLRGGIFKEFCDSLAGRYGGYDNLRTGWVSNICFEPHVGDQIFKNIVAECPGLEVEYKTTIRSIRKTPSGWTVKLSNHRTIKTRILIDGTEQGDVARVCGVPYRIGMDSRYDTGEDIAPQKANDIVQDMTYVVILKDYGEGADKTIPCPPGYNKENYANSCLNELNHDLDSIPGGWVMVESREPVYDLNSMLSYGRLPGEPAKYMINWPAQGNDCSCNIVDATLERRQEVLDSARNITLGFVYFLQTEMKMKNLGIADDEFPTEDHLPLIAYYRESRRISGEIRFSINELARPYDYALYRTGIAVGDYPPDHHYLRNPEGNNVPEISIYPVPSFTVPIGVMIPKGFNNLLVIEKSISVTSIVNGSTRLQPVTMEVGQAAGALAALAVKADVERNKLFGDKLLPPAKKKSMFTVNENSSLVKDEHDLIRDVKIRDVQDAILAAHGYLQPYLDVPVDDPRFKALQRIGSTGILHALGKSVPWSNETWFRMDDPLYHNEIFLDEYHLCMDPSFSGVEFEQRPGMVTVSEAFSLLNMLRGHHRGIQPDLDPEQIWKSCNLGDYNPARVITRGEFAVILDAVIDPFHAIDVDYSGILS